MKNKIYPGVSLLLVLSVLLFSCSPVRYGELETPEIVADPESFALEASWNEGGITATFNAIDEARSYGYTFDDDENPITGRVTFHEGGIYSMSIPFPERERNEYEITIWASKSLDPSSVDNPEWMQIATQTAEYGRVDINSIEPDAYIVERGEDYVDIAVINAPLSDRLNYKMLYKVVTANGKEKTFDTSEFPVKDIPAEETEITLYHAYSDEGVFGEDPQVIRVEPYNNEAVVMDISISGSSISVSKIPSGYDKLEIINSETDGVLASFDLDGDLSHTFSVSDYSGFDSGIFYAEATGSDGRAISKNISFTVPLDELDVSDPVIMRQHYKITLPVADGVSESLFTLDLINVPTAKLSLRPTGNGHETELIISDLSSDTSYMGGRIIAGNTEIPIEAFTTEDFSGTYAYRCSVDNPGKSNMDAFIVDVKFAKESNPDSLYKYYFFASPDDPFNTDRSTKIRMSPLLDGEVPFGERIDYADGNTAYQVSYRWNNKKWNFNERATVYNWTVVSYDASADSYTSEAISKGGLSSALSTDATTTSSYNLIEDEDGNAYLVFFNKITSTDSLSQVGNSYIRKNLDADSELFGENAPYTFVLSLEG